jgi:hypothetical protein
MGKGEGKATTLPAVNPRNYSHETFPARGAARTTRCLNALLVVQLTDVRNTPTKEA